LFGQQILNCIQKYWEKYGEFLLSSEKKEEAHLLLVKALKQLPKREHVTIVKKFCQLEYKYGDIEQGRTLMEGLLVDAAKRIDLWNVYIDLEIKYNFQTNFYAMGCIFCNYRF